MAWVSPGGAPCDFTLPYSQSQDQTARLGNVWMGVAVSVSPSTHGSLESLP